MNTALRSWRDFWRDSLTTTKIQTLAVPLFTLLTAWGAFLKWPLPGTPVPMTMQTFFVLAAGTFLGSKRGALSQGIFLALSAAGLPWLAGPSIYGPTGGYVVGFVFAAAVMGYGSRSKTSLFSFLGRALLAEGLLFTLGMIWLSISLSLSFSQAVTLGLLPFVLGEILKVSALASLHAVTKNRLYQRFP